jgi:hypothetical protein
MVKVVPKGNELHIGLFAWKACFLLVTGMSG